MDDQSPLSPSEINLELLFLIRSKEPNWQRIEFLFKQLIESDFSLVPAQLIQKLGIHYLQHLDRDQEDNEAVAACLLSYQACGFSLPPLLSETLEQWKIAHPAKGSPFPAGVTWSVPALMQGDASASMDSPVVNAWVYSDEKDMPLEIIICGRGMGWVRESVDNAILSTALRLTAKSADVLLEGFTCLRLTPEEIEESAKQREKQTIIAAEAFLTGGLGHALDSLRDDSSPAEAMRELVSELAQLEAKTGLVKVSRRSYVLRSEYQQSINTKTREYMDSGVTLWQHTASDAERVIIPCPLPRLNINLPFSLIDSPEFKQLHNLYRNDLIRAAASDALRRLNFYTSNLSDHANGLRKYLDPATRSSLPETVQLELGIDFEVGLTYRLKDPTDLTRDEYYGKNIPVLVRKEIEWIRKIKRLLHSLSSAISQLDSNLNRLTIARLFDAALRDLTIETTPEVAQAFNAWKKKVQPLLWYLWDGALKRYGLNPKDFCSRQQFFMMDIDVTERVITIRPFNLVDTKTTLFVFDARYPIPLMQSLYDRMSMVTGRPQTEKARQALASWYSQASKGAEAEAQESLKAAIMHDPDVTLREIIDTYQKPFVSTRVFEDDAKKTKQKLSPLLAHNLAIRLWNHHADQSCYAILRQAITRIQNEPLDSHLHSLADVPLTLAWLRALSYFGKDVPAHLKRLRNGNPKSEVEKEIQRDLSYAAQLDSPHVTRCLEKKDLLATKTLRELRTLNHLSSSERSMFNILRALAFVQAARNISLGIEELDIAGESPRSIYAKIGPSMDEVWTNPFIQDTSDQMDDLVNMLLGTEVI